MAARRAREAAGELVLRIDDLDPQRSKPAYAAAAMEDLQWLGLAWDGEPVWQSAQTAAYREAWRQLVLEGWVYPCRCSRRELAGMAGAPHETADEPLYPGTCRPEWAPGDSQGAEDRATWALAGPAGRNWRFRVPDGEAVGFVDGGFGPQRFVAGHAFGDFAVWRRDDVPAYQLASVVDDGAMGVTEVVRGADLLLSAARQTLVFRALGLREPAWFHCALMLDEQGQRLAKRSDALAVRTLRERGRTAADVLRMAAEE